MRLWIGKEREGKDQGVRTLFVEASELSIDDKNIILDSVRKHDIKRIYFGAGRVDLTKEQTHFFEALHLNGCYVVLESSATTALYWAKHTIALDEIVMRLDCDYDAKKTKIVPKIDTGTEAKLFYEPIVNTLNDVKDGMYTTTDFVIYE